MKTISLWEPWASLIAAGAKTIETRSWSTPYRGPLAIHAAKKFPAEARALCETEPFRSTLSAHLGIGVTATGREIGALLPLGNVVATCRLVNVLTTTHPGLLMCGLNRAFGDFTPGRFAWILSDIERLDPPVPARGTQGFWNWDGDHVVDAFTFGLPQIPLFQEELEATQ